jgi:prepilin-type N-terminal cleavage/methylation domain-containing protein
LKRGFTLAEVLITLGIIGVVASLTLPALIANHKRKEWQTAMLKQYSLMQQVLLQMEADSGSALNPEDYPVRTFKPVFMQYFSVAKDCGMVGCIPAVASSDIYSTYSGKPANTKYFDDGQFITSDGLMYMIENPANESTPRRVWILVDTNGHLKKPNKLGYDVFAFELMPDGKLLPMGAENTAFADKSLYCSETSANEANGLGCTYYALTDKDYWKNLP